MRRSARLWPILFTVEGLNIDRFIRFAGEQGIQLRDVRRISRRKISGMVQEAEMPRLRELAHQGGWRLTSGGRRGVGRAALWLHMRWLLAGMLLVALTAIWMASQVMWSVEVVDGGAYEADILAALEEAEIKPPLLRRDVDMDMLRSQLEWRYPRIAWFECGWRGTALIVRPVEGNLPRKDGGINGARDVVAERDGVIATIITKAGTPVVQAGDVVRKGEVLIRGEERTGDGNMKPVSARGSVKARVWVSASVRMPAAEMLTEYSGNQETVWTLRTPWFDLWRMPESSFQQYDTAVSEQRVSGIFLPVKVHIENRREAIISKRRIDQTELEEQAYAAAVQKLREKVGAEESLIDIWGNCSMIDTESIVSVAIGEMLLEIGIQAPSNGMAAPGT